MGAENIHECQVQKGQHKRYDINMQQARKKDNVNVYGGHWVRGGRERRFGGAGAVVDKERAAKGAGAREQESKNTVEQGNGIAEKHAGSLWPRAGERSNLSPRRPYELPERQRWNHGQRQDIAGRSTWYGDRNYFYQIHPGSANLGFKVSTIPEFGPVFLYTCAMCSERLTHLIL